jgi:hypothetical protein
VTELESGDSVLTIDEALAMAERVSPHAQLASLHTVSGSFNTAVIKGTAESGIEARVRVLKDDGVLICHPAFRFRFMLAADEAAKRPEMLVHIEVEFQVVYGVQDSRVNQAEFETFGRVMSLHHAWPYAREFVQSAQQRMEVPVYPLPLMHYATAAMLSGYKARDTKSGAARVREPIHESQSLED